MYTHTLKYLELGPHNLAAQKIPKLCRMFEDTYKTDLRAYAFS